MIAAVFVLSLPARADAVRPSGTQIFASSLWYFTQAVQPPPPMRDVNRYTIFNFHGERSWNEYLRRNPYYFTTSLPLVYGDFRVSVFVSPRVGAELLYSYSTYCFNWTTPLSCISGKATTRKESGLVVEIVYHLLLITPFLLRARIDFFGPDPASDHGT